MCIGKITGIFLLNKQLFSLLKIRRCMVSWTKCWERKSPTYVKNLGKIRGGNSLVLAGKKSAKYLYEGLTRWSTRPYLEQRRP